MADLCMPKCLRVATDPRKNFLRILRYRVRGKVSHFLHLLCWSNMSQKQTMLAFNMPVKGKIPYVHVVNAKNIWVFTGEISPWRVYPNIGQCSFAYVQVNGKRIGGGGLCYRPPEKISSPFRTQKRLRTTLHFPEMWEEEKTGYSGEGGRGHFFKK